jgi:hypothetical protein
LRERSEVSHLAFREAISVAINGWYFWTILGLAIGLMVALFIAMKPGLIH